MSILDKLRTKKVKSIQVTETKTIIIDGQEVTVSCYAEKGSRPKPSMRLKGKQQHDAKITAHMSIADINGRS